MSEPTTTQFLENLSDGLSKLSASVDITSLLSGFLGALILLLIKQYLLRPKISIIFKNDSFFHPVTKMKYRDRAIPSTQAKYLRIKIKNKGRFFMGIPANNCRVYLSSLEVKDDEGKTFRIGEDWIELPYSNLNLKTVLTLPANVPHFIDILFTKKDTPNELFPALNFPLKDYDILRMSGTFKARISVVAENASLKHKEITFNWKKGNFESLEATS